MIIMNWQSAHLNDSGKELDVSTQKKLWAMSQIQAPDPTLRF